jgi:hypothetical protein
LHKKLLTTKTRTRKGELRLIFLASGRLT